MEDFILHVIAIAIMAVTAYDFFILGGEKLTEWKELRGRLANDLHNRALHLETLEFLTDREVFIPNAWRSVHYKEDRLGESEAMGLSDIIGDGLDGWHGTTRSHRYAAEAFTLAILGLETNRSSGEAKEFVLRTGRLAHKYVSKDHKKYYTEKVLRNEIEARYDPNAPAAEKKQHDGNDVSPEPGQSASTSGQHKDPEFRASIPRDPTRKKPRPSPQPRAPESAAGPSFVPDKGFMISLVAIVVAGLFWICEEMTVENYDYGQNDFGESLNADLESNSDLLGLLSDENHAVQALQREEIKRLEEENRTYREREREALRRENEQLRAEKEEYEANAEDRARVIAAELLRATENAGELPGEPGLEYGLVPNPGEKPDCEYWDGTGPDPSLASASKPSWCVRAGNDTERAICDTPRLWALENENRALYDTVKSESYKSDWGRLDSQLNDFVNERNWCRSDVACIEREYLTRIQRLKNHWD